jgi:hypothetical protein
MPALPLDDAGPYVAAAYLIFLALVLAYVVIMASKLGRLEREVRELNEELARREGVAPGHRDGVAAAERREAVPR